MHKMGSDDCVAKEESERDHTEKGAQTQRSNLGQTLKGNLTSHKHRYFKVSEASDNYFETYILDSSESITILNQSFIK